MYVGLVTGSVVATIQVDHLHGRRLLLVERLDAEGKLSDQYDIAVDEAKSGLGDTVLVLDEGTGARQILGIDPGAIRAVIVGVVDDVHAG